MSNGFVHDFTNKMFCYKCFVLESTYLCNIFTDDLVFSWNTITMLYNCGNNRMLADSGKIRKLWDSCRIVCVSQTKWRRYSEVHSWWYRQFCQNPESACLWKSVSYPYTDTNRHDKLGCVVDNAK